MPPATLGTWIAGARPQTLALAVAPVALGTGAASLLTDHWYDHWVRALLALVPAIALNHPTKKYAAAAALLIREGVWKQTDDK